MKYTTKILDGWMALGGDNIDPATVTVNGEKLPETMELDAAGGRVRWADQGKIGEPEPYTFEFEVIPVEPNLATLRLAAIGIMNQALYAAACALTAEPNLDAIKLKQWDEKFAIALQWHNAGRKAVTAEEYPTAAAEAKNRADQYVDPDKLMASWYVNGLTWNGVNHKYWTEFEPAKRAWLRSPDRTVEELRAVNVTALTAEILAAMTGKG